MTNLSVFYTETKVAHDTSLSQVVREVSQGSLKMQLSNISKVLYKNVKKCSEKAEIKFWQLIYIKAQTF